MTDEIRNFRQNTLVEGVKAWAENANLGPEDFFALPLGSALTLPDSQSDIDLEVVLNTEGESPEQYANYSAANDLGMEAVVGDTEIQVLEAEKSTKFQRLLHDARKSGAQGKEQPEHYDDLFFNLLLTPDNLIVGNVELARKMRLEAIQYIDEQGDIDKVWDNQNSLANKKLRQLVTQWQLGPNGTKDPTRNRLRRLSSALHTVRDSINDKYPSANPDDMPGERFESKFQENLRAMRVYPYAEYRAAIIAGNGRLEVAE